MCLKYQWPQLRTHHRYFSSVWKIFQHLYEMLYRVDDFITRPIPRLPDGDNNCLGYTHEICLWQGWPPTKELQHLISECRDQTPLNCTVHLSVLKLYAFRNRAEERGFPKKRYFLNGAQEPLCRYPYEDDGSVQKVPFFGTPCMFPGCFVIKRSMAGREGFKYLSWVLYFPVFLSSHITKTLKF